MGEFWKKKKKANGKIREHWKWRTWGGGFFFLHNTKISSFDGTQKLYWRLEKSFGGFTLILQI